jgi:hypothetical protein
VARLRGQRLSDDRLGLLIGNHLQRSAAAHRLSTQQYAKNRDHHLGAVSQVTSRPAVTAVTDAPTVQTSTIWARSECLRGLVLSRQRLHSAAL